MKYLIDITIKEYKDENHKTRIYKRQNLIESDLDGAINLADYMIEISKEKFGEVGI